MSANFGRRWPNFGQLLPTRPPRPLCPTRPHIGPNRPFFITSGRISASGAFFPQLEATSRHLFGNGGGESSGIRCEQLFRNLRVTFPLCPFRHLKECCHHTSASVVISPIHGCSSREFQIWRFGNGETRFGRATSVSPPNLGSAALDFVQLRALSADLARTRDRLV